MIYKEALNKSWHASYLHIFRLIARKLLEIHQVFLRRFHTILQKICLRNLHTRFNQHFLKYRKPLSGKSEGGFSIDNAEGGHVCPLSFYL